MNFNSSALYRLRWFRLKFGTCAGSIVRHFGCPCCCALAVAVVRHSVKALHCLKMFFSLWITELPILVTLERLDFVVACTSLKVDSICHPQLAATRRRALLLLGMVCLFQNRKQAWKMLFLLLAMRCSLSRIWFSTVWGNDVPKSSMP